MVLFLLRPALPLLLLAGCYRPEVADCATTCAESLQCPDGLQCLDGYCRVEGAASVCLPAGADARATDASTAADALLAIDGGSCPPVPLHMQGCEEAELEPPPVPPYCFVLCTSAATGTAALAFDVGNWHAATLATSAEIAAALAIAGEEVPVWIGLSQDPTATTPGDAWRWVDGDALANRNWVAGQPDDADGAENQAEQCGGFGPPGWADDPCSIARPFLIEHE
jgi:hypothetical protein